MSESESESDNASVAGEAEGKAQVNEDAVTRLSELLANARSGKLVGLIAICFMNGDTLNVQISGQQALVVRLGALEVASDGVKMVETQRQISAKQAAQWAPGGNA